MALGDGSNWDETNPVDGTLVSQIDDYDRDLRIGIRSRMALEHEWPSSQVSTAVAGQHKFVTLQNQAAKPTISGTQLAAIYTKTVGAGLQEAFWENELGTEVQLTNRSNPAIGTGGVVAITHTFVNATSGTTAMVITTTTSPQIGGGFQILTVTHTPTASANSLLFLVNGELSGTNGELTAIALFKGTTADALAAKAVYIGGPSRQPESLSFVHKVITAGTTGALIFTLRAGGTGGAAINIGAFCGTSAKGADITIYEIQA